MTRTHRLRWLSLGVASALLFSACAVERGDEEGTEGAPNDSPTVAVESVAGPTAGDLTAQISAERSTVGAAEQVVVTLTLTNHAKRPVRLLGWYAPDEELEEDLFALTLDDQAVSFVGPHYKRPAPASHDFVTLAPGKSVTRTVDLTSFYDLSSTGEYGIQYAVNVKQPDALEVVPVVSNEIKVWIEARAIPAPAAAPTYITNPGGSLTSSVSFTKCTATQQSTAMSGLNAASTMANGANTYLSGSASGTPRYTTWFGAFSNAGWNTAKTHFVAIKDVFDSKPMTFDCGCKKRYYAYVYPNQPYKIYLCSVFWDAPLTGTDSKGGTIVHETSHFDVVAGTDDWVYGQSGAKSLALSDPTKALDNADTHEYFAENTPALQ